MFVCPPEHHPALEAVKAALGIRHAYHDAWLFLFLANKKFDVTETVAKMRRRDTMEREEFMQYTITPRLRSSMSAGIVQYIGRDRAGHPTIYITTSRDFPTAEEREERQMNMDMWLSWAARLQRQSPDSTITWLVNQKDSSVMKNTDLIFQKNMALRTSKYFPGVVGKMYVCNMSTALSFVFKPLVKQLPRAISDTVFFFSPNDIKRGVLLELFDESVLPVALGGRNECDNETNWKNFAETVEAYFDGCCAALRRGVSIKQHEMMVEFGVGPDGEPLDDAGTPPTDLLPRSTEAAKSESGERSIAPTGAAADAACGPDVSHAVAPSSRTGGVEEPLGLSSSMSANLSTTANTANGNCIGAYGAERVGRTYLNMCGDSCGGSAGTGGAAGSSSAKDHDEPPDVLVGHSPMPPVTSWRSVRGEVGVGISATDLDSVPLVPLPLSYRNRGSNWHDGGSGGDDSASVTPRTPSTGAVLRAPAHGEEEEEGVVQWGAPSVPSPAGATPSTAEREAAEAFRDQCLALLAMASRLVIELRDNALEAHEINALTAVIPQLGQLALLIMGLFPECGSDDIEYPLFSWLSRARPSVGLDHTAGHTYVCTLSCANRDAFLASLYQAALESMELMDDGVEEWSARVRVLRRIRLLWQPAVAKASLVAKMSAKSASVWGRLAPLFQDYQRIKVSLSVVQYIMHHALLQPGGRLSLECPSMSVLLPRMFVHREAHRSQWLFHLYPPEAVSGVPPPPQESGGPVGTCSVCSQPTMREVLRQAMLPESFAGIASLVAGSLECLAATAAQLNPSANRGFSLHGMTSRFLEEAGYQLIVSVDEQTTGSLPGTLLRELQINAFTILRQMEPLMKDFLLAAAVACALEVDQSLDTPEAAEKELARTTAPLAGLLEQRIQGKLLASALCGTTLELRGQWQMAEAMQAGSHMAPDVVSPHAPASMAVLCHVCAHDGYLLALQLVMLIAVLQWRVAMSAADPPPTASFTGSNGQTTGSPSQQSRAAMLCSEAAKTTATRATPPRRANGIAQLCSALREMVPQAEQLSAQIRHSSCRVRTGV